MPDSIFEDPRLVGLYDAFDGPRLDLEPYLALARELGAQSVLDVGCGTGCLANRLAEEGFEVTGLDPARASLDFARLKPHAHKVRWLFGDVGALPPMAVDLAVMTGNVAQVFLTDSDWETTLVGVHRSLRVGGHLVFEARDPAKRAWLDWTREKTDRRLEVPGLGFVRAWCDLLEVSGDLVRFRWTYVFESSGQLLTSDSTLRFREREALENSLRKAGYLIKGVRDAPDRPGLEFVFVAVRA